MSEAAISADTLEPSTMVDVEFRGDENVNIRRDRQFSASQRSTQSSKSVVSMNPNAVPPKLTLENLFCYKDGSLNKAVEECKQHVVDNTLDGSVQGSWLISEINHWDMEKEKLVLLTSSTLLVVQYDFIMQRIVEYRRIMLSALKRVDIGELVYPDMSVMPARQHGGVRIYWSEVEPSFIQRWNPLCADIGYITLCHHIVAYKPDERETATFNVGDMADSLLVAVRQAGNTALQVNNNAQIVVESYGSLASAVYNQSHLGFNMSRGGVCF